MKFSDLIEKGPVIGAPKGSQKDSRMGTDDPSKYMRGGEWEAYREPQGVSSNAGKIAGGKKKDTTRTKNKKMPESKGALYEIYSSGGAFWYNPYSDHVVTMNEWTNPGDSHSMAAVNDLGIRELQGYRPRQTNDGHALETAMSQGWIRGVTNDDTLILQGIYRKQAEDAFEALEPYLRDSGFESVVIYTYAEEYERTVMLEGIQPGGPGVSNDLVARDHHAVTVALVKDTTKANRGKSKLPGSEAPLKQVQKTVKKSLDNRPGNVSDPTMESIVSKVDTFLSESIPRSMQNEYSAQYELMDDKDQELIGVAEINNGVIEILSVRNDLAEDFDGHVMSRLLSTIVRDADMANANLAISMDDPNELGQKRFLERFGFRDVGHGILKRNAGSVVPPSVPSRNYKA